jgi:hypothetical protein
MSQHVSTDYLCYSLDTGHETCKIVEGGKGICNTIVKESTWDQGGTCLMGSTTLEVWQWSPKLI